MFTYTTRKDGRLMKRVSVNGKLKTLYSDNPKDLEKQYIESKYLSNKGISSTNENITMSSWADTWVKTYKKDVEEGTLKMYKDIIRLYINPYIGEIKLKNLKQSDIVHLLNELTNKGITKNKNNTLIVIKQILNKAIENDYIYKNVANGITLKRHKSPEKTPLDDYSIAKIKALAESDNNAFMLLFLIYTGLRRGELIPLQYKDINLEEKYIHVHKAVYMPSNQPKLKDTKNHTSRKVPIFNILYKRLEEMKETHQNEDYVFPSQSGKIMTLTSLRRKLESTLNKLNKDSDRKIDFTLHQLRHTFVCVLHKAGIDVKQAQLWTGHKDIRVLLETYTHLDSQDNAKSIDKVNQFLG